MSRSYNTIHAKKWHTGPSSMKRSRQKYYNKRDRKDKNMTHEIKFNNLDWDNYTFPIQKKEILWWYW